MTYYVGILDGDKDVWGVSIPDVPGCYGGGATPEAAIADAIGALREVAAHHAANGIVLSQPRNMRDILKDELLDLSAAESLVMVPLLLDRGRSVKANISLDAGLLAAIDEEAERAGLTRSSFLASAAVDKIEHAAPQMSGSGGVQFPAVRVPYRHGRGTDIKGKTKGNIRRKGKKER